MSYSTQLQQYRDEIVELIAGYTAELNELKNKLINVKGDMFVNEEDELKFICSTRNNIRNLEQLIEAEHKSLAEIDELIRNPPMRKEIPQERIKYVRKTKDEMIEELITFRSNDSNDLFIEAFYEIDDSYKKSIKTVVKERMSKFNQCLNDYVKFIRRIIPYNRSEQIIKNIINNSFNIFDKYINENTYRAILSTDPPENYNDVNSVLLCVKKSIAKFNDIVDVSIITEKISNELIEEGFTIKEEIKWIDTIEKDVLYDVNDLVESYNEFHKVVLTPSVFGRLEEVKTNFTTKRATIQKKKHTFYQKI